MKSVVSLLLAFVCGSAGAVEISFSAVEYAHGEALSEGVEGAAWNVPPGMTPTNVVVEGVGGIAFATTWTNGCELVALADGSTNDFRQVDFTIDPALLSDGLNCTPDAIAALSPSKGEDGAFCYLGWGDGAWQELRCWGALAPENLMVDTSSSGGEGAAATQGAATQGAATQWISGRMELKTIAGERYVSYLVKVDDVWTRLRTATGRSWFVTRHEQARTTLGAAGTGRLASLSSATDAEANTTTYYWIGGEKGDWNAADNWSLTPGGVAAAKAPDAANEAGVVTGRVEIARGDEKAVVSDAVVAFDANGTGEMIGGDVGGVPTLDTDRPRAGKALTAVSPSLFGRSPDYTYRWYRANYDKASFAWKQDGASFTPQTDDYEHWLRLIVMKDASDVSTNTIFFSKLPVCYLTTDDGLSPTAEKETHAGQVRVQGGEAFKLQYDGAMEIKVRGNTTANAPKKPYKLKLDKKTNMFGFGKQKHWVLLANAFDSSSQRNKLAYDLAKDIGTLAMDSTWVVCTLNGRYLGLYQFCEHIRPDNNRVPIGNWEDVAETPEEMAALDTSLYDITTDYILEFSTEMDEVSKFTTSAGKLDMKTMVNSPEYLCSNKTMFAWVKGLMKDYWDACTSASRCVPSTSKTGRAGQHYSEFCDIDSMVGFTLVNELFTNQDVVQKSRYCYVKDGQIIWGPVWDFDWGSGGIKVSDGTVYGVTNKWMSTRSSSYRASMIAEWASDFYFCQKLYDAYWANRARFLQIIAPDGDMDRHIAYIREAALENDKKWNNSRKFAADNTILRNNLTDRLDWMDKQFSSVTNLIESFRCSIQTSQSTWNPEAKSTPTTDEQGRDVPAVPLEWVREANVGADPSFAYATEKKLKNAVTNAPSVWGKPTPLWEDYVAGTNPDPNGTNAVFRVTEIAITNGVPYIKWTPDLGTKRAYKVLGCEELGGEWHDQTAGDRFFKVDVSLPK